MYCTGVATHENIVHYYSGIQDTCVPFRKGGVGLLETLSFWSKAHLHLCSCDFLAGKCLATNFIIMAYRTHLSILLGGGGGGGGALL